MSTIKNKAKEYAKKFIPNPESEFLAEYLEIQEHFIAGYTQRDLEGSPSAGVELLSALKELYRYTPDFDDTDPITDFDNGLKSAVKYAAEIIKKAESESPSIPTETGRRIEELEKENRELKNQIMGYESIINRF